MRTLLLLATIIGATFSISQETLRDNWAEFKTTHKKDYSSPEEEQTRFLIFTDNSAKIEAHNARYQKGEVSWHQAINKFGDLTGEEFLAFINRTKPTKFQAPERFRTNQPRSKQPIDDEVDWRTKNVLTEVKDEGDCSASWAFSATGALEAQLAIKTGQITSLSEQNVVDCSGDYGNTGCDGGLTDSAYDYIIDNGIMSESDYPYESSAGSCRFDPSRTVTKITSYVDVEFMSEGALAEAVASVGPVSAAVDATESLRFYYGGIFFDDQCHLNLSDLNHAVLVVGYGRELQYDYWIVKNSWGLDWGENGYFKIIRNYGNNCGIATHASYPQI